MLRANAEVLCVYIAALYAPSSFHLCMVLYFVILCYDEKTLASIYKKCSTSFSVRAVSLSLV